MKQKWRWHKIVQKALSILIVMWTENYCLHWGMYLKILNDQRQQAGSEMLNSKVLFFVMNRKCEL